MTDKREAAIYELLSRATGMIHACLELLEDGEPDECQHPDEMVRDVSVMGDAVHKLECRACGALFEAPIDEEDEPDGQANVN